MGPTIICAALAIGGFAAIVARGIYRRKHHKSGCGCGCENCPGRSSCPSETDKEI